MPLNKPITHISQLPDFIPVFPLEGVLLLPGANLPLNIFEPRYIQMIDAALSSHRIIGMIQPSLFDDGKPGAPGLEKVGCACRITQIAETGDGRYVLVLAGLIRFRLQAEVTSTTLFREFMVHYGDFEDDLTNRTDESVDRVGLLKVLKHFSEIFDIHVDWTTISEAENVALVNSMAISMPFGHREKQALLEAPGLGMRAETLIAIAEMEISQNSKPSTNIQ